MHTSMNNKNLQEIADALGFLGLAISIKEGVPYLPSEHIVDAIAASGGIIDNQSRGLTIGTDLMGASPEDTFYFLYDTASAGRIRIACLSNMKRLGSDNTNQFFILADGHWPNSAENYEDAYVEIAFNINYWCRLISSEIFERNKRTALGNKVELS